MAHSGPNVPHRTGRKLALQHGVNPSGMMANDEGYNPQAGVPTSTKGGGDSYKDRAAEESRPMDAAAQPLQTKNPMKVR